MTRTVWYVVSETLDGWRAYVLPPDGVKGWTSAAFDTPAEAVDFAWDCWRVGTYVPEACSWTTMTEVLRKRGESHADHA